MVHMSSVEHLGWPSLAAGLRLHDYRAAVDPQNPESSSEVHTPTVNS